jgi:hypothetical protein
VAFMPVILPLADTLSMDCAAMFIDPSELPWWAWLGFALVFAVVGRFAFVRFAGKGGGVLSLLLLIAFGLMAIGCAFVGIIRFVRWAWG